MSTKIERTHQERRAVVYLRQSTLKQVVEHTESTMRQYALRDRAIELGWLAEQVDVVDIDLGHSGARVEGRVGFQQLSEDIAHGRVGAIFALEVSRLARSCADWHHLLDLCRYADVVIVDENAVLCPRDANDRLLLGLKGTMSEAELSWMRLRMEGALVSKARRGELYHQPPAGYVWDPAAERLSLDPDEQVQGAIRLVFEQFRATGSARGVARYFLEHRLHLPARGPGNNEARWVLPKPGSFQNVLHNPIYAGAYVFGRRQAKVSMKDGQVVRSSVRVGIDAWRVCLRDHHPAYISWEEFMANQRTLHDGSVARGGDRRGGAPREGAALLQGIVLCGRCGHRMHPAYPGDHPYRYECHSPITQGTGAKMCWSVSAASIDARVAALFLAAVRPPEIELALAVATETERQSDAVTKQWQLALDRAQYEARLAERRYKAVDPDNRVIARTLEREWNDKLVELERLQQEYEAAKRERKVDLTEEDRATILALSKDLPRVWKASTTTTNDRKNLVRLLVREVALAPVDVPRRRIRIRVLWQTGTVTETEVPAPPFGAPGASAAARRVIEECVARRDLSSEIAAELNRRGLTSGGGREWTAQAVMSYCVRRGIRQPERLPYGRVPAQRSDGLYSTRGLAHELGVSIHVVQGWFQKGLLNEAEGGGKGRARWFRVDDATKANLHRIKAENDNERARPSSRGSAPKEG